jgi:ketosteroid isomerase-like protein
MGRWSRAELEKAFHDYEQAVVEIGKSWDWASYADHFTEDAAYVEHGMGNRTGREQIRDWISSTMNMFPGSEMPFFPCEWYAIDEEQGWVIARIPNRMKDPGDGSIHESPVITVRKYAGDGKWSYEEDAYNPMNFLVMVQEYVKRSHKLGTLSDDGRTFAKNMNWPLG